MKYFSKKLIKLNHVTVDKNECLKDMVNVLFEEGVITSKELFFEAIMQRENLVSTGVGKGIGIPHGRSEAVKELKVCVFTLENNLDYNSLDKKPVQIIFMLAIPQNAGNEYMKLLGKIAQYLGDDANKAELLSSKSVEDVYEILRGIEDGL